MTGFFFLFTITGLVFQVFIHLLILYKPMPQLCGFSTIVICNCSLLSRIIKVSFTIVSHLWTVCYCGVTAIFYSLHMFMALFRVRCLWYLSFVELCVEMYLLKCVLYSVLLFYISVTFLGSVV